jgi:hypothetical protein
LLAQTRLKDFQNEPGIDGLNGQGADYRLGVGFNRFRPLFGVLFVPPARFVGLDVGRRAVSKGDGFCGFQRLMGVAFLPRLDGVQTVEKDCTLRSSLLPRHG